MFVHLNSFFGIVGFGMFTPGSHGTIEYLPQGRSSEPFPDAMENINMDFVIYKELLIRFIGTSIRYYRNKSISSRHMGDWTVLQETHRSY